MATANTNAVVTMISFPNSSVRPLNNDGTFSLPWRLFFQGLYQRTGGSSDGPNLAALYAAIAMAQGAADNAQMTGTEALGTANEALGEASEALITATLVFASDEPPEGDPHIFGLFPSETPPVAVAPSYSFETTNYSTSINFTDEVVHSQPSTADAVMFGLMDSGPTFYPRS